MNLLSEFVQNWRISRLQRDMRQEGTRGELLNWDLSEAQSELFRVRLAVEAMAEILEKRLGIERHEIVQLMLEIDLRDGKHDHRITPTPAECTNCQRPVPTKSRQCIYCGHPRSGEQLVTAPRGGG